MSVRELKCVGGPADGQMRGIYDGQSNVVVQVPTSRVSSKPGNITYTHAVVYTRRLLSSAASGRIEYVEYLAPAEMSDIDTFRHLLEK